MICKYYLDGVEINPPNNYKELEIELNYDQDGNQQALSINDWEFGVGDPSKGNDGMIMCRNQLTDQTGTGVVQGKPFKITIDDEHGTSHVLFDGYVDLWKAKYERGKITAGAVQAGNIDWINDYADSFTFDYLYNIGVFNKSKFVPIPYSIVKKQDTFEIVMTLVSIFVLEDKLEQQISDLEKTIADASGYTTSISGVIKLILQIAYLIVLLASLVALIIRLLYMLMPPVKYHQAMYVRDLFKIACDYMGLTFKSSILLSEPFNRMVILPEKYNLIEDTGLFKGIAGDFKNNNERLGYYKGSFGDLMRAMKTMFFAKIVIDGGTLYFEPYDFKLGSNGIQVPYSFNNQESYTLNYDEFYATMVISFLTDLSDRHTIQEYKGTSIEVTTAAKSSINAQMSLLRNLHKDQIPFALAKTKTELTIIETLLSNFVKSIQLGIDILIVSVNAAILIINVIIIIINTIIKSFKIIGIDINFSLPTIPLIPKPELTNPVQNRIGMLKMEADFISIPKIFLIDRSESSAVNTKISSDNVSKVNASYLFYNYHYFKSFVSINGKQDGQYLFRDSDQFPFSFADYEKTLSNNLIFTPDGLEGRLITLKFNPQKQTAICSYRVNKHYLSNLKLNIYEPDGQ